MTKSCIFSGLDADNEEHVIPDWLQRRFGLQHAKYQLPSASGIDYRHAKVPAKQEFNEAFGKIETRISQSKFVWEEVYLWLFKIHVGLMYRDTSLRSNVRDSTAGPIVKGEFILHQLNIFREMVKSYLNQGSLGTLASPPGSVFVLPSLSGSYFDFSHSFTTGCVGINVGDYYLAASLYDFRLAKECGYFDWVWGMQNYGLPPEGSTSEEIATWYHHVQAIWLCNLGYWSYRCNINMYRITKDYQPTEPAFDGFPPVQRAEDPEELALI